MMTSTTSATLLLFSHSLLTFDFDDMMMTSTTSATLLLADDEILGLASIHGPRERDRRKELWKWMEEKWTHGVWFFGGDWNSDLQDSWLTTSERLGPHYTRQQKVAGRLDQARLDRIYFAASDRWTEKYTKVQHDAQIQLSDHRPVVLTITDRAENRSRRANYFKTPPELIKSKETQEAMRKIWSEQGIPNEDARHNWDRKWGVVRRYLMILTKERRKEKAEELQRLRTLEKERIRVAKGNLQRPDEQLLHLEQEITRIEKEQEAEWRRWSRTKWLGQGEAPSKFYFQLLKAERAKEITCLKAENGDMLTSKEAIMQELHRYYTKLFKEEMLTDPDVRKLDEVLNLVDAKVGQEWAKKSKQQTLFVKLDFEKAYDRVSHTYLWKTMASMGISDHFIRLTQGLVTGATSKIFAMGTFSKDIELQRGVRQGCPLAPLLFAIASQPLLLILKQYEKEGRIHGLRINQNRSMLVQLFADDSGVSIKADEDDFEELHNAIRLYERISGAKLNLQKSTVIPWGMETIPDWLINKGCKIAQKGETVRYLDFPVGWAISEEDQKMYLLNKVKKRLNFWGYRLLTFQGRAVVLKHILRVIPVYNLACLDFSKAALSKLEAIGRTFLWGSNKEGQPKVPLIAWTKIQAEKKEGGLAICSFEVLGNAMRMQQVTKIITAPNEEWVMAASALITQAQAHRADIREVQGWQVVDRLLLNAPKRVTNAPVTTALLKTWSRAKKARRSIDGQSFRKTGQWASTLHWQNNNVGSRRRIRRFSEGHVGGRGLDWQDKARRSTNSEILDVETRITLEHWSQFQVVRDPNLKIEDMGWYWQPARQPYTGWSLHTKIWKAIVKDGQEQSAYQNYNWTRSDTERRWKKRMAKIWKSNLQFRDRVWLWKVCQLGIPTMERVAKWGKGSNMCIRCNQTVESVSHLFVSCAKARTKWIEYADKCKGSDWELVIDGDLVELIDSAMKGNKPHKLALCTKILWQIWLERNSKTYAQEEKHIPVFVTASMATETLTAQSRFTKPDSKAMATLKSAIEEIRRCFPPLEENATTVNMEDTQRENRLDQPRAMETILLDEQTQNTAFGEGLASDRLSRGTRSQEVGEVSRSPARASRGTNSATCDKQGVSWAADVAIFSWRV
ncbi:hypothetical protein R1sor_021433 [Riccia sorocarpa]|uniref:Reverse transcriptase domain-containing protein n=1 Tax=Riccia sorocarpa TaxID=122646 RepID=A0ABD3GIW7_9MARC